MAEEAEKDFYQELMSRGVISGYAQEESAEEEETQESAESQEAEETEEQEAEASSEIVQEEAEQAEENQEAEHQESEQETEEETYEPEFTDELSKEFYTSIKEGNYERVAEIVNEAVGWKNMKEEDLALDYLKQLNPDLSEDELSFTMAEEFGLGLTPLTDEQREMMTEKEIADHEKQLKSQSIAYKKFLREAKQNYEARAKEFKLEFPDFKRQVIKQDLPEEYKQYLEQSEQVKTASEEWKKTVDNIFTEYKGELSDSIEITIDDSKVAYDSSFVLNDDDKKALYEELLTRVATPRETAMFTQKNGEVDVKGYVDYVARGMFSKQIIAAQIKEAIVKDREQIIEDKMKNSSYRQLSGTASAPKRTESLERQLMSYGLPN